MSTSFPIQSEQVRGGPHLTSLLACDLPWPRFGTRDLGEAVTNGASSWVRRLPTEAGTFYVKTYVYSTWGSRCRQLGRYAGPRIRSRAAREFDALTWFAQNNPFAVEPVACFERRRLGFVHRAVLVTLACPGERVDRLLEAAAADQRAAIAVDLADFVQRCHELGARDGNLDLRNLLAQRGGTGNWLFAKLDSPRFRLRPRGTAPDRWTRADWRRLAPQLAAFGVTLSPAAGADRRA